MSLKPSDEICQMAERTALVNGFKREQSYLFLSVAILEYLDKNDFDSRIKQIMPELS